MNAGQLVGAVARACAGKTPKLTTARKDRYGKEFKAELDAGADPQELERAAEHIGARWGDAELTVAQALRDVRKGKGQMPLAHAGKAAADRRVAQMIEAGLIEGDPRVPLEPGEAGRLRRRIEARRKRRREAWDRAEAAERDTIFGKLDTQDNGDGTYTHTYDAYTPPDDYVEGREL